MSGLGLGLGLGLGHLPMLGDVETPPVKAGLTSDLLAATHEVRWRCTIGARVRARVSSTSNVFRGSNNFVHIRVESQHPDTEPAETMSTP